MDFATQTRAIEFLHQTGGDHIRVDDMIIESSQIGQRVEQREREILVNSPISGDHFHCSVKCRVAFDILDQCAVIGIDDLWISIFVGELPQKFL